MSNRLSSLTPASKLLQADPSASSSHLPLCSPFSLLSLKSGGETPILENIHSTVMEKIIEWCKLSADRPIYDGPEHEMENCKGHLAEWNEDFMRSNWAIISEITRGAIELGCSRLAKSCRFAMIRDIHKMSPQMLEQQTDCLPHFSNGNMENLFKRKLLTE
ncbi:hypothetical protein ACTXT7_013149 [Hymenolepis weldensis]